MNSSAASKVCAGMLFSVFLASAIAAEDVLGPTSVVASRGGATITLRDVDAALLRIQPLQRADAMNSPKRIEELLNQLLLTRQLANAGVEQGLDRDPLVKHAIVMAGENVVGAQAVIKFRESIQLGDVEKLARERYDSNPDAFALPARVGVRHVLIDTTRRTDADALALAERVLARARTEDFESLVMEFSDDPSKGANKGLIDEADSDKMDPAFAAASSKLRAPRELAPLAKSQFGYHIIQLVSRTEATPRSYAEVRPGLVEELRSGLTEQRVKEYVDQLRSMSLDANPDAVASLRTRYLPKPVAPAVSKAESASAAPVK